MYKEKLMKVPRVPSATYKEKDAVEWEISDRISVAFMLVEDFGYTLMGKVRVEKKHWWNRPWKNFVVHDEVPAEAVRKGQEILGSYGYTIDYDLDELLDSIGKGDTAQGSGP